MSVSPEQSAHRTSGAPRVRPARRLVPSNMRADRTISIAAVIIVIVAFLAYDVSGLADLHKNPVTGVDYVPIVNFVAERKEPGEKVLVALPPPAYLALESSDDLIFLSSPLTRKRAQRYTRLTEDGQYMDYWAGVESVVDTSGLCQTLINEPDLWLIVDTARLNADWAFQGSMATVIKGMTYVRYETEGGAQVRRLSPPASRTARAEELCAMAQTGRVVGSEPIEDELEQQVDVVVTPTVEP